MEEVSRLSHATVFRTLAELRDYGFLDSQRVNKKDIIYELVKKNPYAQEIKRLLDLETLTLKKIAVDFVNKLDRENIRSAILYGSVAKGKANPYSDIDILIIPEKSSKIFEKTVNDSATDLSSEINITISVLFMDMKEILLEKDSQFLKSVRSNHILLYGKKPF